MGGWAGLAQGIGAGMQLGLDVKDRKEERALRDKQLATAETRGAVANPFGHPYGNQGPQTGTQSLGGPEAGYGVDPGTRAPRGAMPDFYTADRAADGGSATDGSAPTFWGLLAKREGAGNYSTLYGHSQKDGGKFAGVDVSRMTIGQASQFASPDGEYGQWVKSQVGRVATPMGAPQIVGTTLRRTAKAMNLPDDTPFNEATQRSMATYLAQQRLASAKTPAGKRAGLRAEWEGFKHVSDSDLDRVIQELEG